MRSTIGSLGVTCVLAAVLAVAADPKVETAPPLTRLFVQDLKTATVNWADVRVGAGGKLALDPLAPVPGFKKLDPAKQKLVQMRAAGGLVCVGVRDDADGTHESGWVLVHTGVGHLDHGNHSHWRYKQKPAELDSRLDKEQGNPAHLYLYGGAFYLANDKLNGYTRLDPARWLGDDGKPAAGKSEPQFLVGGGNHITLAVVGGKVGYSCWIDGGGPNKGRVDVTPVSGKAKSEPAYSFHLPSGVIHGATAAADKVFFAPSAGVCWVTADAGLKLKGEQVQVKHIDLGTEGDKPRRTGAFETLGTHVLFVTGKDKPELVVLNATAADPKPVFVPLTAKPGTTALTPVAVKTADGKPIALVFHDRAKGSDVEDALEVIALDPNGDGDFADAKTLKVLKAGRSAVDGHFGHHDVAFDADGRFAFVTNPGDGTIAALSLKTFEVVATFAIGGTPGALVARGGEDHDD